MEKRATGVQQEGYRVREREKDRIRGTTMETREVKQTWVVCVCEWGGYRDE